MTNNSILLQNVTQEELRKIISEEVEKKLVQFQPEKEIGIATYKTRMEVAKILKISLPTLNEYTKTGKIKACRIGGRVLYKNSDVEAALTKIETLKYKRG